MNRICGQSDIWWVEEGDDEIVAVAISQPESIRVDWDRMADCINNKIREGWEIESEDMDVVGSYGTYDNTHLIVSSSVDAGLVSVVKAPAYDGGGYDHYRTEIKLVRSK